MIQQLRFFPPFFPIKPWKKLAQGTDLWIPAPGAMSAQGLPAHILALFTPRSMGSHCAKDSQLCYICVKVPPHKKPAHLWRRSKSLIQIDILLCSQCALKGGNSEDLQRIYGKRWAGLLWNWIPKWPDHPWWKRLNMIFFWSIPIDPIVVCLKTRNFPRVLSIQKIGGKSQFSPFQAILSDLSW